MARFHPKGFSNEKPATYKVYRALAKALDDRFLIRQHHESFPTAEPCFTVVRDDNRLAFLRVSVMTKQMLNAGAKPASFVPHFHRLNNRLYNEILETPAEDRIREIPILWLFPDCDISQFNLPTTLKAITAGKQQVQKDFGQWIEERLSTAPLEKDRQNELFQKLNRKNEGHGLPKLEAPAGIPLDLKKLGRFLDTDQQRAAKLDLHLPGKESAVVRNFNLKLVTGVAGSGKSLILLRRLQMLRESFPNSKALVLIHNRPILWEMERRYQEMSHGDDGVVWKTFMAWCRSLLQQPVDCINGPVGLQMVEPIWKERFTSREISKAMLLEEFSFIKDRLIFTEADYLTTDRTGRGFRLTKDLRQRIFQALEAYQAVLQKAGKIEWGDLPRLTWRQSVDRPIPHYDFIMIDEAQFFAPIWFELVKKAVRPDQGTLFLTADPAQGFLKRRRTWLSAGLDVKGRSSHLTRSYRTTRIILRSAMAFVEARLGKEEVDQNIDVGGMHEGVPPRLDAFDSALSELSTLAEAISSFDDARMVRRDILILTPTKKCKDAVMKRFPPDQVCDLSQPGTQPDKDKILVCMLKAATGLEAALVWVPHLHELFDPENNPMLDAGEQQELMEENTRLIYMAMTRASQKLVLSCVGKAPDALHQALENAKQETIAEPKEGSLF